MQNKASQKQTWSELQQAVVANNKKLTETFLEKNKKKFCKKTILTPCDRKPGWNVLQIAACLGYYEIFCMLVKKLGDTNHCFKAVTAGKEKGWNCLHLAAAAGHHDIVSFILLELSTSNPEKIKGVILETIEHGKFKNWNALHLAAYFGHTQVVQNLLCQQDDEERIEVTLSRINQTVNYLPFKANLSALHLALIQNHVSVVRAFLHFDTKQPILDLIEKSSQLMLPEVLNVFQLAVFHGHVEIVAHLLKLLADDPAAIETLITKAVTTNFGQFENLNAFHIACMEGHVNIVNMFIKVLLSKTKDIVNYSFPRHAKIYNALILANEGNHNALTYILVKNGGKCNYDLDSIKPIFSSMFSSLQSTPQYLLEEHYLSVEQHLSVANEKILNIIKKIDLRIQEVTSWAYENRILPLDIKIYICCLALGQEMPDFPGELLQSLIKENLTTYLQKTQSIISFTAAQKHRDRFFKIDNEAFSWAPKTFLLKSHLIYKLLQTFCQKMSINFLDRQIALQLIQKIAETNLTEDEINNTITDRFKTSTQHQNTEYMRVMTTPLNSQILEKDLVAIANNSLDYCASNLSPTTAIFKYWKIVAMDKKRLVTQCLKNFFSTHSELTLTKDIAELLARNISKTYFLETEIVAAIQKTFDSIPNESNINDNNKRDLHPENDSEQDTKRQKTK